jgi:hypothetical protein
LQLEAKRLSALAGEASEQVERLKAERLAALAAREAAKVVGATTALSARDAAAAKRLEALAVREAAEAGVSWVLS